MPTYLPGDRGSTTLELVVWAPVLLLIGLVIVLAGRVAQADQTVEVAAAEAARAASAASTAAQARSRAAAAAHAALSSAGLHCAAATVSIDTSQWSRPPGTPARVSATIGCRVAIDDLAIPGLPGTRTITSTATSAIDTYRARP
ncbi:MAG: TadE/TadG family type IV pilus assembly protein [Propionicimonas sp.]